TETGALSTKLDGVFAQVNPEMAGDDNLAGDQSKLAGAWTEQSARIEGDLIQSQRTDGLIAEFDSEKKQVRALILEESSVRVTENSALAEQVTTLSAKVNNDIDAAIKEESRVRTAADESLAEQVTTLSAKVNNDIAASIQEESRVRALGDESLAEQVTTLSAKVNNDITAAIQEESRVRTDQNSAMAEQVTTLQAEISSTDEKATAATSAIQTESQARISKDDALAQQITTLQTKFGDDISAAIQQEATTRASADSALSETIETVQTTVDGHTSSIQETKTAVDGINAEWKIKVQAGGRVSGVSLGTTGAESDFIVLTNRFSVVSPDGQVAVPFVIDSDGRTIINTAVIKDGSIANAHVGNLSADKITSGDIAADRMKANIVEAVDGQFDNLGAITAKIGHLRTADTGARLEFKGNLLTFFDSDETPIIYIGEWDEDPIEIQ
ncbi:MAG TPA: hypothetical protein PLH48_01675, partial [Acinetobacter johnsonii]|nr:hypothetical protein [Acinetobacter johnsonii]